MDKEEKTVFAYVPPELHRRLKIDAAARGATLKETINIALEEYLDRRESEGGRNDVRISDEGGSDETVQSERDSEQ